MRRLALLFTGVLAALVVSNVGCAAPPGDDAEEASAAAQTSNPAYDEAVRTGRAKVVANDTPNDVRSSESQLVGYIATKKPDAVLAKLLDVKHWTEIEKDGAQAFTSASLARDDDGSPKRTVDGKVVLEGDVALDVRLVATEQDGGGYVVSVTNTSSYRHWLLGTVLEKGKLAIDVKILPYERGTIVDARAKVKLLAAEDRAPTITGALGPIFEWLKKN